MIRVTDPEGRTLASRFVLICDDGHEDLDLSELEPLERGVFLLPEGLDRETCRALVSPEPPGFWTTHCGLAAIDDRIVCPRLDEKGGASWWHDLLGPALADPKRGSGIRIGVVDSSFRHTDGLGAVKHLQLPGARPPLHAGSGWAHGEAVCRILADRGAPASCAPIAPGASLFFASASYSPSILRHPVFRVPANGGDDDLDFDCVQRAIFTMIFDHKVDLINLSLGTFEEVPVWEEDGFEATLRLARGEGVTVICAAGNAAYDEAGFPARLRGCVGVGAYGAMDWGARDSFPQYLAGIAQELGAVQQRLIFYSPESAYGNGINTIAPGVGVLVARGGAPAFALTGTSFAAPIATGLLAVALSTDAHYLAMPRNEARARYAEKRLAALCIPTGIDADWEGDGAILLS